jgi:cytidylate kinase
MKNKIPVITIDGPSGTGKGTLSQLLAQKLGWHYLDSGALYRLLALFAQQRGVKTDDIAGLVLSALQLDIHFRVTDQHQVLLDNVDVTSFIRTEEIGRISSIISSIPEVREALRQRQIAFRQAPGLVTDGRDMGTVIFPDADLKIFMTASAEVRAKRRYNQLKSKGIDANLADILDELNQRDWRDRERVVAPLKPAEDAVELDTSELDIPTVLEHIMQLVRARHLITE